MCDDIFMFIVNCYYDLLRLMSVSTVSLRCVTERRGFLEICLWGHEVAASNGTFMGLHKFVLIQLLWIGSFKYSAQAQIVLTGSRLYDGHFKTGELAAEDIKRKVLCSFNFKL